jgi:hypothetical protein
MGNGTYRGALSRIHDLLVGGLPRAVPLGYRGDTGWTQSAHGGLPARLTLQARRGTTHLLVAAFVSADPEPQLVFFRTDHRPLDGDQQPILVMEEDGEGVVDPGSVVPPLVPDDGGDGLRQAEQMDHLVQEVYSEVIDRTGCRHHFGFPG